MMKIRFLHERLAKEKDLQRHSSIMVYDIAQRAYEEEVRLMTRAVQRGLMEPFDVTSRRKLNDGLAALFTVVARGMEFPDLPVRRYLVNDDLYRALMDTQPVSELYEEDLKIPFGAIVIRWPTGEETYALTVQRMFEAFRRLSGELVLTGTDGEAVNPSAIMWQQFAPSYTLGGPSWFGFIDTKPYPDTSPPGDMEEVRQREAVLRNLLGYLNQKDRVDEIVYRPTKEKRAGDPSRGRKDAERFYSYVKLGSRTRYLSPGAGAEHEKAGLHWVAGHWRRQVCGVGRRDRKLIWIAPFLRGHGDKIVETVHVLSP